MKKSFVFAFMTFLYLFTLSAGEDKQVIFYQDSIRNIIEHLPHDSTRLIYLSRMAYFHQYAPQDNFFSTLLYNESRYQKNLACEYLGAHYLAGCYNRKHDPDSLALWVDRLKVLASQTGNYDHYLEQKAALSRAQASRRMIEKAIFTAKETLEEAKQHKNHNGELESYNSLACAYMVSSRSDEGLNILFKAHKMFTDSTRANLKIDILSRICGYYGNRGLNDLKRPYMEEMGREMQKAIAREPEARNNWTNMEILCEVEFIMYYMNKKDYPQMRTRIDSAKALLTPHVDPVCWLNLQLMDLQYYARTQNYDKSIALIDEVTPTVIKNHVNTFGVLTYYKSLAQTDKGDIDGAIRTRKYLIRIQDSLNNAFSVSQLKEIKEIYHIDELLQEKQKISNDNLIKVFTILGILAILILLFYIYTRYLSRRIAQAEKAAAEAAARSEAVNQAKEYLRKEISHDVRTPLNTVVGFAELLSDSDDHLNNEIKSEYSRMIQKSAGQLLEYVNSILELSRLESGKIKYEQENIDPIILCKEVVSTAGTIPGNKVTVSLVTDIEQQLIRTDKQAFLSLLTSMIVYRNDEDTNAYHVTIFIEKDTRSSFIHFKVANTPLAEERSGDKTRLIRNEINAHLIHFFGGEYRINVKSQEDVSIEFRYPACQINS